MNEAYEAELQQEINFLYDELAYLQGEITDARKANDSDEYARLCRVYLPMQKQYLKEKLLINLLYKKNLA